MALQLSHEAPNGFSGNYWKIMQVEVDYNRGEAYCNLCLFKDAAASAADKAPIYNSEWTWSGADFTGWFDAATLDVVSQNPQERAYVKIKAETTPIDFSTATDV